MNEPCERETIWARATAVGDGAVAILRVSGPKAVETIGGLFRSQCGRLRKSWRSHRVVRGFIVDPESGRRVDEVLVLYMRQARSFTGEEVVEVHCHGGTAVIRNIGRLLALQGARAAEPGEFTRRAFLAGRISLDEAEAVDELVRARSEEAALVTVANLSGELRTRIVSLRSALLSLLALLEANVDFPEDEVDSATLERVEKEAVAVAQKIGSLTRTFERGRSLREGVRVVLSGRPNVGKSSLMNALLKSERSIVTEVPGTTRDTIEESLVYRGLSFVLIDTAGLRQTADPVESLGVERAQAEMARAAITVLLLDATGPMPEEEMRLVDDLRERAATPLVVVNKMDAARPAWLEPVRRQGDLLEISALTGEGVDELLERLYGIACDCLGPACEGPIVSNQRHQECLLRAERSIGSFLSSLEQEVPIDVCLIDLHDAANHLGSVTGEIVSEQIMDEIFSRFCIGK